MITTPNVPGKPGQAPRRLYEYCGDIPPADLEHAYYAQIRDQPIAELSNR